MPYLESKGWFSAPVLASHQCGLGSNPGVDSIIMWVEFVVGFSPLLWGVPQVLFPSPQKAIFPNSNSTRNQVDKEPLCGCATSKSLFTLYLFIYLFYLSFVSEACHPKIKAVLWEKLKGTQCSESVNSRLPSVALLLKSWDIIVPAQ